MSGGRLESRSRSATLTWYLAALTLGLGASAIHWSGILLGGILIGLLAPSTARGIVYGAAFGLFIVAVSLGRLGLAGTMPPIESVQIVGVSAAIPVILGAVGGSAHELWPWIHTVTGESSGRGGA